MLATSERKISEKDPIIEVLKANIERLEKRRMEVDSKENFKKTGSLQGDD